MAHPISSSPISPSPVPPEETPSMQLFNTCMALFRGWGYHAPEVLSTFQAEINTNTLPLETKEAIFKACKILSQILSKQAEQRTEQQKAQLEQLQSDPLLPQDVQQRLLQIIGS